VETFTGMSYKKFLYAKGTDLNKIGEKTCCRDQTGLGTPESPGNICAAPVSPEAGKPPC
jgi:hypothetical protein